MSLSSYIRRLPLIQRSNRIGIAVYDPVTTYTHFIYRIDRYKNDCMVLTAPTSNTLGTCELTVMNISAVDDILSTGTYIILDSPYIGRPYLWVQKELEKY